VWLHVPSFPGRWNQLIRKDIREMLATLDFYCALLLSIASAVFRLVGVQVPAEARLWLAVLVVLALSSYAQCLFGLDGAAGFARYKLLPLGGWEILAAKDTAFLLDTAPPCSSAGIRSAGGFRAEHPWLMACYRPRL
jgi:hypothetical protein